MADTERLAAIAVPRTNVLIDFIGMSRTSVPLSPNRFEHSIREGNGQLVQMTQYFPPLEMLVCSQEWGQFARDDS